jgi:hypothetical protein
MQQIDGTVDGMVDPPTDQLENLFTYHSPGPGDTARYMRIRGQALSLARTIEADCPRSPDRSAAIRKLRECVMTANASIATNGGHYT